MSKSNGSRKANSTLRTQIEDAVIRFAIACDEGDPPAMAECITDDFVVHIPGQSVTRGPGRDVFVDCAVEVTAARHARGQPGRHMVTNVRVKRREDMPDGSPAALARSYVAFVLIAADGACNVQGF